MTSSSMQIPLPDFHYTPSYCEENVYLLCKSLCTSGVAEADGSDLFVVFISNEKKQTRLLSAIHQLYEPNASLVPLWHQKASQRADGVFLWDYHVICVQRKNGKNSSPQVWDLDSSLPFPSSLESYVSETIRPSFQLFSEFQRFFRVVHAPVFLLSFASDRRHMKDAAGNWIAEPPLYEAIAAQDGTVHNLNEYIEISSADVKDIRHDLDNEVCTQKLGVTMSGKQLQELFSIS